MAELAASSGFTVAAG
ncbi:hypothetical protein VCCP103710_2614, partial [Vibrio cholerae CP1037(10)]